MTSLTRDEAQRRAALLSITSYEVALDLTAPGRHFRCVTTARFAARPGPSGDTADDVFVDVAPHRVRSARLNGRDLDVAAVFDAAAGRLALTDPAEDNVLVVDADMSYSHDGEGLHRHVDPADGSTYVYAMSFLDAAPRWFACFDQPDLKATVTLEVTVPDGWRVAGNGPAVRTGANRWRMTSAAPLSTYFTTLIAGPYHEVRDRHDGIELVLHARRSLAAHLDRESVEIIADTKRFLDELHALFGVRYPWGEYHQAFVPEFNAGAMENPGCVTLRDELVFRSRATDAERALRSVTVAHEMAHMWFGDLVTMRWWDDLWLNESFAEYLGYRVCGADTWPAFGVARKSWGFAADRRPSTHPVAGNGAADARAALAEFDGISYAKGASVLRQLATRLGDEVFLAGLRDYIRTHAGGNATFADLTDAWERAGARDLRPWARSWLRTTGLDTLAVRDGNLERRDDAGTPRPHAIEVAAFDGSGRELGRVPARLDDVPIRLDLPDAALVLPDAGDATWAKIALSDWPALPGLLPHIEDARARVVVWNALRLAVADAELDPRTALRVVTAALPGERDDVITSVGGWAVRTAAAYLDGDARGVALGGLAAAMHAAAHRAPPASGAQLAGMRVTVAATPDATLLRGWLAGTRLPDGVVVDAELRWTILERLAALGALDADGIEAELAADRTSAAVVHAARCHASRPDAAAKSAAWAAIMRDAERPNLELYALADGFWLPGQDAWTDPYVPRYFAEIGATATLRTGWVLDRVALRAYPCTAVRQATLDATAATLTGDVAPVLRRPLVDAGDDLRRALTSRTTFPP